MTKMYHYVSIVYVRIDTLIPMIYIYAIGGYIGGCVFLELPSDDSLIISS